ncbi:MAG: SDR family oxidoreductase [Bacteroidia bacterium]|nr:SDR family oxidoreductase [Bacteroidia bacterium]
MTRKKIFITGASKGIGLAIAQKFYEEAYEVIICARKQEGLDKAKALLPGIHTFNCDVSDVSQIKALAEKINKEFGAMDVLVNNAGSFQPGAIHEEEDAVYEAMMSTNMDSAYYMTKGILPLMISRKSGTVVNIASIASISAYANGGSYSISKYALLGFSKNLREEMKPHGIRVISVMPGATYTASWEGVEVEEDRLMPVEDIAELVFTCVKLSGRSVVEDIVIRPQLGDL